MPNPLTSVSHNTASASPADASPSTARFVILPCMPALLAARSAPGYHRGITGIRTLDDECRILTGKNQVILRHSVILGGDWRCVAARDVGLSIPHSLLPCPIMMRC